MRDLVRVGRSDLALPKFEAIVRAGLHCPALFERDPWLDPLRAEPGFADVLALARAGHAAARTAFEEAGGPTLLMLEPPTRCSTSAT